MAIILNNNKIAQVSKINPSRRAIALFKKPSSSYLIDALLLFDQSPRLRVIRSDNTIVSTLDAEPTHPNPIWATAKNGLIFCGFFNAGGTDTKFNLYKNTVYDLVEQDPIVLTTVNGQAGDVKNDLTLASIAQSAGFSTLTNQNTDPAEFLATHLVTIPNDNGCVRFSPNDTWIAYGLLFSVTNYIAIGTITSTTWTQALLQTVNTDPNNVPRALEWLDNTYIALLTRLGNLSMWRFNGVSTLTNLYTSSASTYFCSRSMLIGVNNAGSNIYYLATGQRFFKFDANTETTTDLTANIDTIPATECWGAKWVQNRLFACFGTSGLYVYDRVGDNLNLLEIIASPGGGGFLGIANFQT